MELRVLQYFLVAAREENITRAATQLHITQPTLSRQLMQLEEELGVKLFHRGNHNILLTVSGEISIGCGETQNMKVLCEMMTSFRQKYPDVSFEIYTAIADDVKERLENGILDMGLLLEPVEISRYQYIKMPIEERWRVLMRRDSPLAGKEKITPDDLVDIPLIIAKRQSVRNELEHWFGQRAEKLRIATTCNLSYNNQSIMVESGLGVAMTMEFSECRDTLCLRPLEPEMTSGCVLVWKKSQILSPAVARFIKHMRERLEG